ncbi:MAG TPA: tetratricopeptide repeat protein [Pirellulales bacterium]
MAITFAAYVSLFPGAFVLDDDLAVTSNPLVKAPDGWRRIWLSPQDHTDYCYWPVTSTAFWIQWRLWGANPTGYHAVNLALHILDSLLIWRLLNRLRIPGAFLAALLFSVHPVNVESVAWIAQLKNLLAMLFGLLTILCWLRSERLPELAYQKDGGRDQSPPIRRRSGWYWLSIVMFMLAILSKSSIATLPLVLLLIQWWRRQRITAQNWLGIVPLLGIAAAMSLTTLWFQNHDADVARSSNFIDRLLGAGAGPWFYLSKALWPADLAFIYPQWQINSQHLSSWLPLLATVALSATLVQLCRWPAAASWSRPLLFAWAAFCVMLIPAMGFVDSGYMSFSLVADHYQHLALVPVVALVAAGWKIILNAATGMARLSVVSIGAATVVLLTIRSNHQASLYASAIDLYQATLQKNPDCWLAENNLGIALAEAGKLEQALPHFQTALALKPDYAWAEYNWGLALFNAGRTTDTIQHFQQAIKLDPNFFNPHYNLGVIYSDAGQFDSAIVQFETAARLSPGLAEVHLNLGTALAGVGRLREACDEFDSAARLNPDSPGAYVNLALTNWMMHRPAESIAAAKTALQLAQKQGDNALAQQMESLLRSIDSNPKPSSNDRRAP